MPSLKQILNAFGKASARNAFPSTGSRIKYSVTAGNYDQFTAPQDGYFCIDIYDGGRGQIFSEVPSSAFEESGNNATKIHAPVKKGQVVKIYYKALNTATADKDSVYFVPCKGAV